MKIIFAFLKQGNLKIIFYGFSKNGSNNNIALKGSFPFSADETQKQHILIGFSSIFRSLCFSNVQDIILCNMIWSTFKMYFFPTLFRLILFKRKWNQVQIIYDFLVWNHKKYSYFIIKYSKLTGRGKLNWRTSNSLMKPK